MLALAFCASGCSPSSDGLWRGYVYGNVLSNAAPSIKGPYADGPQCVAAMHALLRQAPATASFTCGRGCKSSGDGAVSNCAEVAR